MLFWLLLLKHEEEKDNYDFDTSDFETDTPDFDDVTDSDTAASSSLVATNTGDPEHDNK